MNDLISRQAAIDAMATWDWQEMYLPIHFKQLLEDLPSAQQWIPCSERLPEDGRAVLIYAWSVHYVIARYGKFRTENGYKKTWVTADAWNGNTEIKHEVIAWMPLPEPWEEVEDES